MSDVITNSDSFSRECCRKTQWVEKGLTPTRKTFDKLWQRRVDVRRSDVGLAKTTSRRFAAGAVECYQIEYVYLTMTIRDFCIGFIIFNGLNQPPHHLQLPGLGALAATRRIEQNASALAARSLSQESGCRRGATKVARLAWGIFFQGNVLGRIVTRGRRDRIHGRLAARAGL